jgi:hypothetical protein
LLDRLACFPAGSSLFPKCFGAFDEEYNRSEDRLPSQCLGDEFGLEIVVRRPYAARCWTNQTPRAPAEIGAPRPMKMGTTASPWRYDAAAAETIWPDNQRRTSILRYASRAAVFPISPMVRLPFDSGPFDQSRDGHDGPEPEAEKSLTTPREARCPDTAVAESAKAAP